MEKSEKQKVRLIVQELNALAQYKSFKLIDKLLVMAITKLSTSSVLKIIIYARTTSQYRSELPHWNEYVQCAKKELDGRNIDSAAELAGLL